MSKLIRRIHMYLALFLTPWILMYTLSTLAMNHRHWLQPKPGPPPFTLERELTYDGALPDDPKAAARQLLLSLDMDGAHNVNRRDGALIVVRQLASSPVRLTYTAADHKLKIERQQFKANAWLERFHRRRGFQHDYLLDDLWAFSVDFTIAAIVFWALSGLWMWWEMKVTRRLGAAFLVTGCALFAFYVRSI